jgi:hypothetical protein
MQHADVKAACGERENGDKSPRPKAPLLCAVALLMGAGQAHGAEPAADPAVEIRRTKPDFVLFDPTGGKRPAWNDPDFFWLNEHVLVQPNGRGELLAMWSAERFKPREKSIPLKLPWIQSVLALLPFPKLVDEHARKSFHSPGKVLVSPQFVWK